MEAVNQLRKAALLKVISAVVIVPVIAFVTFKFSVLWWHYAIGAVLAFVVIGIAANAVDNYEEAFIKKILKPVLEANGLHYFPKDGLSEKEALSSSFFDFEYDDYDSYDLIVGDDFKLAYVKFTKEEEYEDSDGDTQTETVTKYAGFLAVLKHNRFIRNYLIIEPSRFHLNEIIPITYDKYRVKLDNPEFEKVFDVYSADQVEARYLLDHNYMNMLIGLNKKAGVRYLSFIKDVVFTQLNYSDFKQNIPLFEKINDKIIEEILFPVEYAVYVKKVLNGELDER